jgi:hypothetical protein
MSCTISPLVVKVFLKTSEVIFTRFTFSTVSGVRFVALPLLDCLLTLLASHAICHMIECVPKVYLNYSNIRKFFTKLPSFLHPLHINLGAITDVLVRFDLKRLVFFSEPNLVLLGTNYLGCESQLSDIKL